MGLFDSFFGAGSSSDQVQWNYLTATEQVEDVFKDSNSAPQIILKHSNSCGTSYFAKKNVESISEEERKGAPIHLIDVIRSRPISIYLGDKVSIRHESPQVFVIKNGEVIWSASHGGVNTRNILQALG
ncbi:MAG: bacillithiol system redox-active protein YtxJ [Balneola sp.]|nr:MAG: bacillithiol system redox-active protein YtxJ [Balneola sp.]